MSEQRILIIKLGALGDMVVATPHIEAILSAYPRARVTLLTSPPFERLFATHPRLEVESHPRKGAGAMWRVLRFVRRGGFDAVFDLQGSERSAVMTWVSGARLKVGLSPDWVYDVTSPEDDVGMHIHARLSLLLSRAGVSVPEDARPRLWPPIEDETAVDRWLTAHGLEDRPFALLHAGSSAKWAIRRWPAEHFLTLAGMLEDEGVVPVWLGGPDEIELNRKLAAAVGVDATGAFSVTQIACIGRKAAFALVNDTGPMHLLSTAGIPVFTFFGPTDWRRHHAVGQSARVLLSPTPPACSPCYVTTCRHARERACLTDIRPEQVLDRLRSDGCLPGR